MNDQDLLLSVAESPANARILAEIWQSIQGEPLAAARLIRSFQGLKGILRETIDGLPAMWQELEKHLVEADLKRAAFTQDLREFRANNAGELKAAVDDLKQVEEFFARVNKGDFLNQANRVLDLCERLQRAKKDGTLAWLQTQLNTK